ncbi:MAG: outer membrane protein assembly factor BamB family protein [Planctomycetota bacterium]
MEISRISVLILLAIVWFTFPALGSDWPQWRGIDRDGTWHEKGILETFPQNPMPTLWRAKIANGYSGPTVANGRVYVTDRITEPEQKERVLCFDAMSGKSIWTHSYPCKYKKVGYPDGPRTSVLIQHNKAYSLGTMGHLFCLDTKNGNIIWQRDLYTEYDIRMPVWGISASPVIEENLLILQIGGKDNACLIGLDKNNGKEIWRALPDKASYSSPIVIDQAEHRVLVCLTGQHVVGLDPINGKIHWEYPFGSSQMVIAASTPVYSQGYLLLSSFYDGSLLLKVNPDELSISKVWHRVGTSEKNTDALHCIISTPFIQDGSIYGVDSYGELRCLDLHTGNRVWESLEAVPKARWATIHFIQNDEITWMFNERGELIISQLSRQGFKEISRTKLIEPTEGQLGSRGGVCWSHPAFANKHVYIRNDNELICVDLSKKISLK